MNNIRNFSIIAHIDHGKSTLADRLLEFTGTVEKRKMKEQMLDTMELERERGITIKLQPARMTYHSKIRNSKHETRNNIKIQNSQPKADPPRAENDQNSFGFRNSDLEFADSKQEFVLNLIDTPGHIDFTYEVSRSLAAVEGALLLVDATQGVQAQTLGNLYLALEQDLTIIPIINKIDLPNADVKKVKEEIVKLISCPEDEILLVSAKTGEGVEKILEAIIERVPPPKGASDSPPRALIFDSNYDEYRGVVAYVRLVDGVLKKGDKIKFLGTEMETEILNLGYLVPNFSVKEKLNTGEIGYVITALKNIEGCRVGDTITISASDTRRISDTLESLPGYKEVKPMVFAGLFPKEGHDIEKLREAMEKLKLNDAAMSFEPERNTALGFGFRAGFLGLLHLEITKERLKREYNIELIITVPSVAYHIYFKNKIPRVSASTDVEKNPRESAYIIIKSASDLPDPSVIDKIEEPHVSADIITPKEFVGGIMKICEERRGNFKDMEYLGVGETDTTRVILHYDLPLSVILIDFYDKMKSVSRGYASLNYEVTGYEPADIIKLNILVNGDVLEELSTLVYRGEAYTRAREITVALKNSIPRQAIEIKIQAAIGGKIVASERIAPFRKDVLAKLYGGDVTRKMKLLKKQKKGKKKMLGKGSVSVPTEAYLSVLKR